MQENIVSSSVYWVLYWWLLLYFKINKSYFLMLYTFEHFSPKYDDRNSISHSDKFLICCLKQVCEWYNFVVLENVTCRDWACLFRFKLINDIVFIQICFSNLSLIYKLKF